MKKLILGLVLIAATLPLQAQTWNEWFKQKKTQLKYLQQQIVATQALIGQVRKGYAIARSGLDFIGQAKDGHFQLDAKFFASLKQINPAVREYGKVVEMIELSTRLAALSKTTRQAVNSSDRFSPQERAYVEGVFSELLVAGLELTEVLVLVLTKDKLELSDDQRLQRIDALHAEMKDRYAFAQHFVAQCRVLLLHRQREAVDAARLRELYGFPKQ